MVHVRTLDGRPLSFGHSGWLWHNAYLLYDVETDSLWHHLTGRAMAGPLRGRSLRRLPTTLQTFGAWRAEHPGTLVLRKPDVPLADRPVDVDVYAQRNAQMHFGFGLDLGPLSRFYPFARIAPGAAVEDDLGGTPVVVVRDPAAATAFAYDRRVGGRTLSFRGDTAPDGRPVLRDAASPRAWYARSGTPVAGTGAEAPLTPLTGSVWEDAAWSLQHPEGTRGGGGPSQPGR